MILLEGPEFDKAKPEEVVSKYLSAAARECLGVNPANLSVKHDGKYLMLQVVNGKVREYPIRKSFMHKLLKWYSFPVSQLQRMSMDTVTGLCNDYLLGIKADNVRVKTENGEALTIVSDRYNDFPDLEVIEMCGGLGIDRISRNDFVMRIYTHEKFKTEPVPNDPCGFGLNIINSETGFGALDVSHYILRYICSNGAVARVEGSDGSRIHFGHREGEMQWFLNDQILKSFENRFKLVNFLKESTQLKAKDYVKVIGLKFERVMGRGAWSELLGESYAREGLGIAQANGIVDAQSAARKIRNSMGVSGEPWNNATKYDLFNAITDKAKGYGIGEKLYLERIAGEMIGITQILRKGN